MSEEKHVVAGGGTRSEKAPSWHLAPLSGHRRTARRFGLGAESHGAWNWAKSVQVEEDAAAWADEAFNHMMEHIHKMASGIDPHDDHLGAIGWAHTILCYVEERFGKPWTVLTRKEPRAMVTR